MNMRCVFWGVIERSSAAPQRREIMKKDAFIKLLNTGTECPYFTSFGGEVIDTAVFFMDKPKGISFKKYYEKLDALEAEVGRDNFTYKQYEYGAFGYVHPEYLKAQGISFDDVCLEDDEYEGAKEDLKKELEKKRELKIRCYLAQRKARRKEQARLDALRPNAIATQQLLKGVHGDFAEHLTRAFLSADDENQVKLLNEFEDVFRQANTFQAA